MAGDDLTGVGLLHPAEQAQERGLAGAVEAQDHDPAASVDGQVDACEDLQGAIGLGQPGGAQRGLAAGGGVGEAQVGDLLHSRLVLQVGHETLGPLEHLLGGHGFGGLGPHLLPLGAQGGGLLLGVGALPTAPVLVVGALLEVGVPAQVVDVEDPATGVEVHDLVDGVAQELNVVADDDEAPGVGTQVVAQPQDRVVVEMVGGLIEQERVGLLEQDPGELDPTALTT